jgi:hypothetical protein
MRGDAMAAGLMFGGMIAGAACGMVPLLTALRLGRVATGCACFVLCVGAGLFGGLIAGAPTAFVLTGLVSMLGNARSVYPLGNPYEQRSRHRDDQPYVRLGQTIVCNDCRTASPVDSTGRPHVRCPGCGLPFREDDTPAVRRRLRDDDIIDLKPATQD